jgi:TonB family protein
MARFPSPFAPTHDRHLSMPWKSAMLDKALGPKVAAWMLSLSVHAGVAYVAAEQRAVVSQAGTLEERVLEIPAPELEAVPRSEEAPKAPLEEATAKPTLAPARATAQPARELPASNVADDSPALAPSVVEAPAAASPRFAMTVGSAVHAPGGTSSSDGGATAPGVAVADAPVAESAADVPARLLAGDPPAYTKAAQEQGIEADVPLEIVIDGRGSVVTARATTHVGYGLDEVALESIRQYHFRPAERAGRPTAVRMRWLMRFQLR